MKKLNELFRNTYKKTESNKFLDRDGLKMCNLINVTNEEKKNYYSIPFVRLLIIIQID